MPIVVILYDIHTLCRTVTEIIKSTNLLLSKLAIDEMIPKIVLQFKFNDW